jgi:hypothetical protein
MKEEKKKKISFQEKPTNVALNIIEKKENRKENKKPTISYEDILSSLNMTVVDGKLQYTTLKPKPTQNNYNTIKNTNTFINPNQNRNQYYTNTRPNHNINNVPNNAPNNIQKTINRQSSLPGSLRKTISTETIYESDNEDVEDIDYSEEKEDGEKIEVMDENPLGITRERYNAIIREIKRRKMVELARVQQIKSTKMFFQNNNNHYISIQSSKPNNLNKFFYFKR